MAIVAPRHASHCIADSSPQSPCSRGFITRTYVRERTEARLAVVPLFRHREEDDVAALLRGLLVVRLVDGAGLRAVEARPQRDAEGEAPLLGPLRLEEDRAAAVALLRELVALLRLDEAAVHAVAAAV